MGKTKKARLLKIYKVYNIHNDGLDRKRQIWFETIDIETGQGIAWGSGENGLKKVLVRTREAGYDIINPDEPTVKMINPKEV